MRLAGAAAVTPIDQPAPNAERVFEIELLDPSVELFCFTFG